MGYGRITTLLKAVGKERNAFVHGEKVGVNPILVDELVDGFFEEHSAWVKIHNLCLKETREAGKALTLGFERRLGTLGKQRSIRFVFSRKVLADAPGDSCRSVLDRIPG